MKPTVAVATKFDTERERESSNQMKIDVILRGEWWMVMQVWCIAYETNARLFISKYDAGGCRTVFG